LLHLPRRDGDGLDDLKMAALQASEHRRLAYVFSSVLLLASTADNPSFSQYSSRSELAFLHLLTRIQAKRAGFSCSLSSLLPVLFLLFSLTDPLPLRRPIISSLGVGILYAAPVFAVLAPLDPSLAGVSLSTQMLIRTFGNVLGISIGAFAYCLALSSVAKPFFSPLLQARLLSQTSSRTSFLPPSLRCSRMASLVPTPPFLRSVAC
jgi:hypothetical protein